MNGARVVVLVEGRYLGQRQPAGLIAALRSRTCDVTVVEPRRVVDAGQHGWLEGVDAVAARGRSLELLCLLTQAEQRGLPVVDCPAAVAAVRNKATMAMRLMAAGIPTPRTFLVLGPPASAVPDDIFPAVVKPVFGDNGRDVRVVAGRAELDETVDGAEAVLVQQWVPNEGFDLTLYGIADQTWAVSKPSPLAGQTATGGVEVAVTPELRRLARRCGRLFGLQFFGVDCLETPAGPLVIEVNDFPNYSLVPGADDRLAQVVLAATRRQ